MSLPVRQCVDAAQLVTIAGERVASTGGRSQRLVTLAEHRIGPYQAKPSIDVGAVLGHPLGKTGDHAFDHSVPLGRRHLRGEATSFAFGPRGATFAAAVSGPDAVGPETFGVTSVSSARRP